MIAVVRGPAWRSIPAGPGSRARDRYRSPAHLHGCQCRQGASPIVSGHPGPARLPGGRGRPVTGTQPAWISASACAPSAALWNSCPTRRIGQYASGASRIATIAIDSGIAPLASRIAAQHGDDRHRDRRQQLQRRRGATRSAVRAWSQPGALRDRPDRASAAARRAVVHQGRQPAYDIEKVPAEVGQRPPAPRGSSSCVARPINAVKSGNMAASTPPRALGQSTIASVTTAPTGNDRGGDEGGRYPRDMLARRLRIRRWRASMCCRAAGRMPSGRPPTQRAVALAGPSRRLARAPRHTPRRRRAARGRRRARPAR